MSSKHTSDLMNSLKKRNLKRFSLFIAIAFIFLIISKLSNDYKQAIKLKVKLVNMEEEIMLQQDSTNVIDVIVEAKGFALVPYIFNSYKTIVLDSKTDVNAKSSNYIFDVQKHEYLIQGQLGSSYKLLSVSPDTLKIPYSKRASKFVPLTLNSSIEYAAGFDIMGTFNFSVDSIKIVGPEAKIANVNEMSTKELKLSKVNNLIDETLEIEGIKGVDHFPKVVNVKAEVKRFTEGTIEVPVTITGKPKGVNINFFPKTVTILYYVDLDRYGSISANDFRVECHFDQMDNDQTYFVPVVTKRPEFIKRLTLKQKRIDFIKL